MRIISTNINKTGHLNILRSLALLALLILSVFVIGGKSQGGVLKRPSMVLTAACVIPATTYGTDTMTLTVPTTGTYEFWARIETPTPASVNEFMLQVNGSTCYNVGGVSTLTANTWTWVNYTCSECLTPITMSLNADTNYTFEAIGTEAGLSLDRIMLLQNTSCVPTGTGDNCGSAQATPPAITITSPTSGATVSGTSVPLTASITDTSGIKDLEFEINKYLVYDTLGTPYTSDWNSTLTANGTYTFSVTATDENGLTTTVSEPITVDNTCSTAPSVPTGLAGTATSMTAANLTWTASTAGAGCTVSGYHVIETSSTGVKTTLASPTTTSYAASGLTPNTKYTFSVESYDAYGSSAASATIPVTTETDTTAPTPPTSVTATDVSPTEVTLKWDASTDNVGVTGYKIYRNSVLLTTVSGTTLTYNDTNLTADTDYSYSVSAIDAALNESAKTVANPYPIKTPVATNTNPPATPSALKDGVVTSSSVALTWTEGTGAAAASEYLIYRGTTEIGTSTTTSYTDSTVAPSSTYSYDVVAESSSGVKSAASSSISVTTLAGTSTGSCTPSIGDIQTGTIGAVDLSILLSHWGVANATAADGDLNCDGAVNATDLSILLSHWGQD
jgi:chitodextrinase